MSVVRFRPEAPYNAAVAHLVERHLAKVEVASSSLVSRSRKQSIDFQSMLFVLSEGFSAMRKHIFFYPAAPVRDFAGSCISDAEGEDMPHRGVFGRLRRPGGVGAHRQGQKGTGHQVWFPVPS